MTHTRPISPCLLGTLFSFWLATLSAVIDAAPTDAELAFFEQRIRPVLVERCYACHNSIDRAESDLALDYRGAIQQGGARGSLVVPGEPEESLLMQVLRHTTDDLRMPEDSAKLSPPQIADFEQWIEMGAPDPRDEPPSAEELKESTSWETIRKRRMEWWSFQPVDDPAPPEVTSQAWAKHPIDRFVLKRMQQHDLQPSDPAEARNLIRRLSLALTGLPPTPQETDAFLEDRSPEAYQRAVDRLLNSPHFGERWARHWMDWMRYAESHSGEGDPNIPYVWRYRDYLIRALNEDVAYDQLIREHIAGDLLAEPRITESGLRNESALGIGHYRFVQHGYAPTDALDEQVRFTENQIDVLSKAFLGLTVSCARCHDHKFDPISQADFYAMYGVMVSSRPATITVTRTDTTREQRAEMRQLKQNLRESIADAWMHELPNFASALVSDQPVNDAWRETLEAAKPDVVSPLIPWAVWKAAPAEGRDEAWTGLLEKWESSRARVLARQDEPLAWRLGQTHAASWFRHGTGLGQTVSPAGTFHVLHAGETILSNIYPAGVYSHELTTKDSAVLTSPHFDVNFDELWVRIAGGDGARVRYAMQHYPRVAGPVYKSYNAGSEASQWKRWDMRYWNGDRAYVEIATAADIPIEAKTNQERSWFGMLEVVGRKQGADAPQDELYEFALPLWDGRETPPADAQSLAESYRSGLQQCIEAWRDDRMTDGQARFLGFFLRQGLLPNTLGQLPHLGALVTRYRQLEVQLPVPDRAPGVVEAQQTDQPLFARGNHTRPGEPVPRRYLEAFDGRPFGKVGSGRRELAEAFASDDNPLTARVAVNRLWHHLFGKGLVGTPDNFGHVGQEPTHPLLLDYLATRFKRDGYSIKNMIRLMVSSQTWRQASTPSEQARRTDPGNQWLSCMPFRRLEAEAIRDSLLLVSGKLDPEFFGKSVGHGSPRRSIYLQAKRNNRHPFLAAFDTPIPFTTTGRREVTNVPAQSLALLNDSFVIELASHWAQALLAGPAENDEQRMRAMFVKALNREPTDHEIELSRAYLVDSSRRRTSVLQEKRNAERSLRASRHDLAQLVDPLRAMILKSRRDRGDTPTPFAKWDFEQDARDCQGELHGQLAGEAKIKSGKLLLNGKGHLLVPEIGLAVGERTLEIVISLPDLGQKNAGAIGIQATGGGQFDTIAYGRPKARTWSSDSDGEKRTQDVKGPQETSRDAWLHLAAVYSADGRVQLFRHGKPYGEAYTSEDPLRYSGDVAQLVIGARHITPQGVHGRIKASVDVAQFHTRALSADEVLSSAANLTGYVATEDLLAVMTAEQRVVYDRVVATIDARKEELDRYSDIRDNYADAFRAWQDLGLSLFNLKEFIFIQ